MKLKDYLCTLELDIREEREGGYTIRQCLGLDNSFIRLELGCQGRFLEAYLVSVPFGKEVPLHRHNKAIEYFLPGSEISVNDQKHRFIAKGIMKFDKGEWHGVQGPAEFYVVKEYDKLFDKEVWNPH